MKRILKQLIRRTPLLSKTAKIFYDWKNEKAQAKRIKDFLAQKVLPYEKEAPKRILFRI